MNQKKKISDVDLKKLQEKYPEATKENWQNYVDLKIGADKKDVQKKIRL